jgi:hypothetical protein
MKCMYTRIQLHPNLDLTVAAQGINSKLAFLRFK